LAKKLNSCQTWLFDCHNQTANTNTHSLTYSYCQNLCTYGNSKRFGRCPLGVWVINQQMEWFSAHILFCTLFCTTTTTTTTKNMAF